MTDTKESYLKLGRYALIKKLARGGMGSVYLGRAEGAAGFRKPVAIKIMHSHLMANQQAKDSFIREAKIAARLVHPNIVQVLDFGEQHGHYQAVLEYVHGYDFGNLTRYMAKTGRPFGLEYAIFVIHEVLRGLDFAHSLTNSEGQPLGLVHCDISPHNVLISVDGQVKITDFGVAHVRNELSRQSSEGFKGKVAYQAPEQVAGQRVDHRTDIFAAGIVLYESLAGERLFYCGSEAQTIMKIHQAQIPSLRSKRSDIPPPVEAILAKALARDPNHRYQSAAQFASDLRGILGSASLSSIEPHFRTMIRSVFGEESFVSGSGSLVNLAEALDEQPILDSGSYHVMATSSPPQEEFVPESSPHRTKRRGPSLVKLTIISTLGALISAAVVTFILWGMWTEPQPSAPVAVIVDRVVRDAGPKKSVADAGKTPIKGKKSPSNLVKPGKKSPSRTREKLSGEVVTERLLRRRTLIRDCFGLHGSDLGEHSGVTIVVEIARNGKVLDATVEPGSVRSKKLGRCLVRIARTTRFPAHDEKSLSFRIPIVARSE